MIFQDEWIFNTDGKPISKQEGSSSGVAIRVRVITHSQAIASAKMLQPQVETLYVRHLATITDAPVTATAATNKMFTPPSTTESVNVSNETAKSLESRSLVFLAYYVVDAERTSDLVGFTRIYPEPLLDGIVGSALVVDPTLSDQQQEALETALVYASQPAGEATTRTLLTEKRAAAELDDKPVPTSQAFYRTLFLASDVTKRLLTAHGLVDEPQRLEMSKDLEHVDAIVPVFPDDVEVKSLDLNDHNMVQQFYEVLKQALGSSPPSFEAWKIHYAQHPRFAPELSFIAQSKTDGTAVAAIAIERIVEGEGGGDDEISRVFATSGKLQAHSEHTGVATSEPIEAVDDALQRLLSATSATAVVLPSDYDAKKAAIAQRATVGYVCGAATSVESRGKGLASGLLRCAFQAAARETSLREIILGTDVYNTSAVRAYERAGMVVTKRISSGRIVVKYISLQP